MTNDTLLVQLRAELMQRDIPAAQQPDDETLQMMLDVEHGDVNAAAEAIRDAHTAEMRVSSQMPAASATTSLQDSMFAARASTEPAATSLSAALPASTPARMHEGAPTSWLAWVLRLVSWPVSLVGATMLWCFRLLHRLSGQRQGTESNGLTRYAQDPDICARVWIDELERDTNGSISRDATSIQRVSLPPFIGCSYSEALRRAKYNLQILVVILTSQAHSDYQIFRQHVLTDPALVRTLQSPDLLVWGGDIRDREAFRVGTLLEASTYPFIAFIALQPRRSRSRGTIVPHPAVLSRIEGSPHTALSASALSAHITDVLLPRTYSYLTQLRRERRHRDMERDLRMEQDRAYEEASQRDQARVLRSRAEHERQMEKQQSQAAAEAERAHQHLLHAQWRSWARASLVPKEPDVGLAPAIRISVKMPDGRNLQRRFRSSDTLEQLYAYVDTIDVLPLQHSLPKMDTSYVHTYKFHLVQTYPRRVLPLEHLSMQLQDIEGLGPSANLIVEASMSLVDENEEDDEDEL